MDEYRLKRLRLVNFREPPAVFMHYVINRIITY